MSVDAVILAAGYSSRAKAFKMALEIGGKPILQRVIEAFIPLCQRIIVVGGYRLEDLKPLVAPYGEQVELVVNPHYEEGMFSSIKVGVSFVKAERFFLTPGDYPLLTTYLCQQLLKEEGKVVIPSYKKRGGHPILISSSCISELFNEEVHLKHYLSKQQKNYVEVGNEAILIDVDTRQDYERVRRL